MRFSVSPSEKTDAQIQFLSGGFTQETLAPKIGWYLCHPKGFYFYAVIIAIESQTRQ